MAHSFLWGFSLPAGLAVVFTHTLAWAQAVAVPDTVLGAVLPDSGAASGVGGGYVLLWGILNVQHLSLGAFGGLLWFLGRPVRRGHPRYEPGTILRMLLGGATLGNFATLFLPALIPALRVVAENPRSAAVEGFLAILAGFLAEPILRWARTLANRRADTARKGRHGDDEDLDPQ